MELQQFKDELFRQVSGRNTEGIRALCREGADLEWTDKEGKTPLIAACLDPALVRVATTLLELGADPNAYRPGYSGGTPLHHAAERGLQHHVTLLLSYGANALVMNDDCETPLQVARAKGCTDVVRVIENCICLFSGWLREINASGFLDSVARRLHSRKVWVVILPTGSHNPTNTCELELAIYPSLRDARPCNVVALWKATLEEPKFNRSDPSVKIVDDSPKTRLKLASATGGDKQQLRNFWDACKGIPQVNPTFLNNSQTPVAQATAPPDPEDLEVAMAIEASIHSAMAQASDFSPHPDSGASGSTGWNDSGNASSRHVDIPSSAASSSCVICVDAPVEGACVPCGHMCGCMSCLNEVEAKIGSCPVCCAKINLVTKLYAV